MDANGFYNWLVFDEGQERTSANSRVSCCRRIDAEHDLDAAYSYDKCATLLPLFDYSKKDMYSGLAPMHGIAIDGNLYTGTATLKQSLKLYIRYMDSKPKKGRSCTSKYCGDYAGFIHFINGYCRNLVNNKTRATRNSHKCVCEYCKCTGTLESAHISGMERPIIIKQTLDKYFKKAPDYYEVDLIDFEEKFMDAQTPYKDHFYFLCRTCHKKYDNGDITPIQMRTVVGR